MEPQSDIGERERRTVVAEQMNDNPQVLEITLENSDHLWIRTPHGDIRVFVAEYYRTITSWVDNVDYTGFYNQTPTKKTHKKTSNNWRQIQLSV